MALHRSGGLNDLDDTADASDETFDGPYEIEDFDSPEDAGVGRLTWDRCSFRFLKPDRFRSS